MTGVIVDEEDNSAHGLHELSEMSGGDVRQKAQARDETETKTALRLAKAAPIETENPFLQRFARFKTTA